MVYIWYIYMVYHTIYNIYYTSIPYICIYQDQGSPLARGLSYSSCTPTPRFYTPLVFALQDTAQRTTALCGCPARMSPAVSQPS